MACCQSARKKWVEHAKRVRTHVIGCSGWTTQDAALTEGFQAASSITAVMAWKVAGRHDIYSEASNITECSCGTTVENIKTV
jgi:hypothetical protein